MLLPQARLYQPSVKHNEYMDGYDGGGGGGGGEGGDGGRGGAGGGIGGRDGGLGGGDGIGGCDGGIGGGNGGTGEVGGGGGEGGSYGIMSGRLHIRHFGAMRQSGTEALVTLTAFSHDMHRSPKRHCPTGTGGTQSSSQRGPSNCLPETRLWKQVE
jgi:hypothetical protein